jgi:hypothetical protein
MKTNTQQKLLAYIKQRGQATAKEIIEYSGYNATGIFRHLKKLIKNNLIIKQGKLPKILYLPNNIKEAKNMGDSNSTIIQNGFVWNESGNENLLKPEAYCPTRDVFQARLDHLLTDCLRQLNNENLSYLLVAVTGEIGNNSFDHNLGNWHDIMGIYFAVDLSSREIILADRGQGIFSTIKKVRPNITSDKEALHIAFTETISGRAPEQRGNGLKFVRKIIADQSWQLDFYSGNGFCKIKNGDISFASEDKNITGTVALIKF